MKEYIEREAVIQEIKEAKNNFSPTVRPIFDVATHFISHAPAVNIITVDNIIEQLAKFDPYIVDGVVMFDLGEWTQWLRDIGAKEGSPLNEHYELGADMDEGKQKTLTPRCNKCVHQLYSCNRTNGDKNGDCPHYKRDPKDGGFYG